MWFRVYHPLLYHIIHSVPPQNEFLSPILTFLPVKSLSFHPHASFASVYIIQNHLLRDLIKRVIILCVSESGDTSYEKHILTLSLKNSPKPITGFKLLLCFVASLCNKLLMNYSFQKSLHNLFQYVLHSWKSGFSKVDPKIWFLLAHLNRGVRSSCLPSMPRYYCKKTYVAVLDTAASVFNAILQPDV